MSALTDASPSVFGGELHAAPWNLDIFQAGSPERHSLGMLASAKKSNENSLIH